MFSQVELSVTQELHSIPPPKPLSLDLIWEVVHTCLPLNLVV